MRLDMVIRSSPQPIHHDLLICLQTIGWVKPLPGTAIKLPEYYWHGHQIARILSDVNRRGDRLTTTMLRISVHDETESTSFTVEGSLTARVVDELKGVWEAAVEREPLKPIVVKLAAASFLDAESKNLLSQMYERGVKLEPRGWMMKSIIAEIESAARANAR